MNVAPAYLSQADISTILQEIEAKYDLLQYRVDGWSVWPTQRFSVFRALQSLPLAQRSDHFSKREIMRFAGRDLFSFIVAKRSKNVVKTFSSAYSEIENGLRKDVYFDDVIHGLGDVFKIEITNNVEIARSKVLQRVPRDMTTQMIDIAAARLARYAVDREMRLVAEKVSNVLRRELNLESFSPARLTSSFARFRMKKRLYKVVLRRLGARTLLLADTGDYPVTAASRELGVKVVEFQHGSTHRHHPSSSWSPYAVPYKSSMPIPDRVFVYGPHWQRVMEANGFWREELRIVGSARMDVYRALPATKSDERCDVLVTAQGTDTEHLIRFLKEFLRISNDVPLRLTIKMHPIYDADRHAFEAAFAGCSRVRLIGGAEAPGTFDLMKESHLHATIFSTCHYEALALGVPTIILPLLGAESVADLHRAGHALAPRTAQELLDIVSKWRELSVPPHVSAEYFTPGAVENALRELQTLEGEAA